ncbi:MAG: S1C family serine protease [Actinomycetes bacterium]
MKFLKNVGMPLGVVIIVLSFLTPLSSARAANENWDKFLSSPADGYNKSNLDANFDLTQIDLGVSSDVPDQYEFFLNFVNPITPDQFTGKGFASLLLDTNNDGKMDFSIDTTQDSYEGNFQHAALLIDRHNEGNSKSDLCAVTTWTNLDHSANWIAFSLPIQCLPMNSTIGIQGYADSGASGSFDYAPESIWKVDLTADSNKTASAQGTSNSEIPSEVSLPRSVLSSPSNPPADLAGLANDLTKSVVTVFCADGLGSGWSAKSKLSSTLKSEGYRSYIITNFHVIASCTDSSSIEMVLHDGSKISGKVWAWDQEHDVAGILTTSDVPPLNWSGGAPQQGWWVGVLGSPLGHPGILTTGIVSSVQSDHSGTTTAPINHGNSGGPVFDRNGRVLGLATAVYVDSQGFGIFNGTPMLCGSVMKCNSPVDVWAGSPNAGSSTGAFPLNWILVAVIGIGALVGGVTFYKSRSQQNGSGKSTHKNSYQSTFPSSISPGLAPPPPPSGQVPPSRPTGSTPPPWGS